VQLGKFLIVAETMRWCNAQAPVSGVTRMYACGSCVIAGRSRHASRIECASDYDIISRPVVHDSLVQLQAPHHGHVVCVSLVLLHCSRPERQVAGVTRLGPDSVFLYFDFALSSHCGIFRESVRLARSLLEHPKLRQWSVDELVVPYVQEVYPYSFTRVDTSKRSAPRHCALQMCSIARNFTCQASIYVI